MVTIQIKWSFHDFNLISCDILQNLDQYDVVDLLLKNDADISIPDDSERTLVDVAKRPSNYFKPMKIDLKSLHKYFIQNYF